MIINLNREMFMKISKIVLGTIFVAAFATSSFAKAKNHDGEIIAYMEALNNGEISAAKVAEDKKVDDSVMKFAEMMVDQHGQNLQQVTDISSKINVTADETSAVKKFKETDEKNLTKLSKLEGTKFQKSYIQAMINGHKDAARMITKFEKEAQNPDLKQYLADTKKAVEQHLADAKQLS